MSQVRTFGGRYEVLARAGSGGMAEVYRGRDSLLGREVAIKVLSPRLSHDRAFVERFRREAQTAAGLNHPNIVQLYDFGSDDGTYFIVMEYIDGKTLDDIILDEGALLPERAAEITSDVAKGLGRAHEAGLVHRDIKPSNIMITRSGQTKVTDFGIARALSNTGQATMTQTGMVIGTAAYLSPEQAQGNPVDARSDVYSLGCVLHEMLTGSAPFEGDTPLSVAYKHVREEASRPSAVNPDVPDPLDAIVLKAMSKNPDNRYPTAAEMGEDLDRFLAGQKVAATPFLDETAVMGAGGTQVMEEPFYEEPRRERSNTGRNVLITLLVLALLGALAFFAATNLLGQQVQVPDVTGLSEDVARGRLENRGFTVAVERRNSQRPEGRVFRTDPEGGEQADEGSEVIIFVSRGPGTVEVPNLIGLTRGQAVDQLESQGLELGQVDRAPDDTVDEGQVFAQNPEAGTEAETGSPVDIAISTGPEAISVPSVIGFSEQEAISTIENAGLTPDASSEPRDDVEAGTVFAQDPEGGTEAQPDDVVVIVVSEGPEGTPVPDVTGQSEDDAVDTLEGAGFDVEVDENTEECPQPPGTVCFTDPEAGSTAEEGDTVTIFVQPDDDSGEG